MLEIEQSDSAGKSLQPFVFIEDHVWVLVYPYERATAGLLRKEQFIGPGESMVTEKLPAKSAAAAAHVAVTGAVYEDRTADGDPACIQMIFSARLRNAKEMAKTASALNAYLESPEQAKAALSAGFVKNLLKDRSGAELQLDNSGMPVDEKTWKSAAALVADQAKALAMQAQRAQ